MNKIKEIREFLNAEKMKGDVFTNKLAVIGNGKELDGVKTIALYKEIEGGIIAIAFIGGALVLCKGCEIIYNKLKTRKISKNIQNTDISAEVISDETTITNDEVVEDTIIISED